MPDPKSLACCAVAANLIALCGTTVAAPLVTRLTPPSVLFASNGSRNAPIVARFLPGQAFDLQATVIHDGPVHATLKVDGATVAESGSGGLDVSAIFDITGASVEAGGSGYSRPRVIIVENGVPMASGIDSHWVTLENGVIRSVTVPEPVRTGYRVAPQIRIDDPTGSGAVVNLSTESKRSIVTVRNHREKKRGIKQFELLVTDTTGSSSAKGNFEIVDPKPERASRAAKNVIILLGDGMGAGHRTAARLMLRGVELGKAKGLLAMETFPFTGLIMTASLNSIVTDSSPGASCYSTGNKGDNNEHGVFPDDTRNSFDNPRVESIGEFLSRTEGKALGIITTSEVTDATPAAFATHTSDRVAGSGIADQMLDEACSRFSKDSADGAGLKVLMGGGRKFFLPESENPDASTRTFYRPGGDDYTLPPELASAYGITAAGHDDDERNLLEDFKKRGFAYAPDHSTLSKVASAADRLLGLFAYSNMNVALDKIGKRRGTSTIVDAYGFPDQPMLDEMTAAALNVLRKDKDGFVLLVEGASIDKQSHNMDSDRWLLEMIEFDRAVQKAKDFASDPANGETLVLVLADHECGGVNVIGASRLTDAELSETTGPTLTSRKTVGTSEDAGFPTYAIAEDGYPVTTNIDHRLLIGYASNAARTEDWRTNVRPLQDPLQPPIVASGSTYATFPPLAVAQPGQFIPGQTGELLASHTATDVPISAFGRGADQFTGVMDNTDLFFKIMRAIQPTVPGK
jgi:alkaline phosphatase